VREKEDVCAIVAYLLSRGCRRIVLWGRSMGAATAVMFYGAYQELLVGTVVALVLDSPFTSLQGLANQFNFTKSVPGLILEPALQYIRHSILSLHGFDILQASPLAAAQRINIPAIVLSGSEDKTVPPLLSEELYRALVGPKMRIFFLGSHNSKRPPAVFEALRHILTGPCWTYLFLSPSLP
jgi:pimeloyl-ACP methyl ester carboxylesterase